MLPHPSTRWHSGFHVPSSVLLRSRSGNLFPEIILTICVVAESMSVVILVVVVGGILSGHTVQAV